MSYQGKQAEQILCAIEAARRLGWSITIDSGRASCSVTAKRTAIPAGTRETEYDATGLTIVRTHLRDALAHLLMVITIEAEGDENLSRFDGRGDLRTGVAP